MMLVLCIFTVIFVILNGGIMSREIYWDLLDIATGSYVEGYYNISYARVSKFNRTTYVLNGKWDFLRDIDDDFNLEITMHYNRFNNNQYTKSLIGMRKDNFCKVANKYGYLFLTENLRNHTNFGGNATPDKICPVEKVRKYIRNIII